MSFFVFKLLFAALALGLLVVFGLIARNLWRKRARRSPPPARETPPRAPKSPPRQKPRPGRKAMGPAPAPEAPPPVRRRQLQSFAEAERRETEAAAPPPQPVAESEPAPAAPPPLTAEPPPPAMPEAAAPPPPDEAYDQVVLARLEDAFEALQAGAITLATYRTRVLAEQAAVEQRIAALEVSGSAEALEAALTARASVRWCLDWAAEQDGQPGL